MKTFLFFLCLFMAPTFTVHTHAASPIAVFAYNRPQHLQITLEALKRCEGFEKHPLSIFCDAARGNSDLLMTAATQAVAKKWCQHYGGDVIVRKENKGYLNIVEGITQMCEKHGRCIIVEDDIVVSPDFLSFMEKGLERYQNDKKVFLISGFMYHNAQKTHPTTFFLPHAFIWGWATWDRAWKHYRLVPEGTEAFFQDTLAKKKFNYSIKNKYSGMLQRALNASKPHAYTWDIQWSFIVFQRGGLGLYPSRSLVWNSGIACGVHGGSKIPSFEGRDPHIHGQLQMDDFTRPRLLKNWSFPNDVQLSQEAYKNLEKSFQRDKRRKRFSFLWKKIRSYLF